MILHKIRLNLKPFLPVILLILLSLLCYWAWITPGIISFADWPFVFKDSIIRSFPTSFWSSVSDFGSVNVFIWRWPLDIVYKFFAQSGLDFASIERVVVLWPIILMTGPSAYLLVKEITQSKKGGFIGGLFLSFNTYYLAINTQGHLLISLASIFSNLSLWVYFNTSTHLKNKIRNSIIIALLLFVCGSIDLRVLYITIGLLGSHLAYTFFIQNNRRLERIAISFLFFGLLGVCFASLLIGLTHTSAGAFNSILERNLFGNSFWRLDQALALFFPFWTGGYIEWFKVHPILIWFWIIPLLVLFGILLNRKNISVLFFSIIALVGILLTKQVDAPFADIYPFLFQKIPGFNAFREASKFYYLIALSYAVIISHLVLWCDNNQRRIIKKCGQFLLGVIIVLFVWNISPYITLQIKTILMTRSIPSDYIVLKKYLQADNSFSRVLWLPRPSQWGYYDDLHPSISGTQLTSVYWNDIIQANTKGQTSLKSSSFIDPFSGDFSERLLDSGSIKYIVVPTQDVANDDDFYQYYGSNRQAYVNRLDAIQYLTKLDLGTTALAVYLNKSYLPYINSADVLLNLPSLYDFDLQYKFIQKQLGVDFQFTTDRNQDKTPTQLMVNPFKTITSTSIVNGSILESSNTSGINNQLYVNVSKTNTLINILDGKLSINQISNQPITINGEPIKIKPSLINLRTIPINKALQYIAQVGTRIIPIEPIKSATSINLGTSQDPIALYQEDALNIIPNPSFEFGSWREKVGDCNAYDNRPLLNMNVIPDEQANGNQVLQLAAIRHIACTDTSVPVVAGNKYLLGFDYQSDNSPEAGYYIGFDDLPNTFSSDRLTILNNQRQTFSRIIDIPQGASHLHLYIYSFSKDDQINIVTRYTNFNLHKLALVETIPIDNHPVFQNIALPPSDSYTLKYSDPDYTYTNIIPDGSFETALWQKTVGDCNNFDDNPVLGMARTSASASDGVSSLQLEAKRHNACTTPGLLPINENTQYLFTMDYQSPNSKMAGYYLGFNDEEKTIISEKLTIADSAWQTLNKTITTPPGATTVSLFVYSYATDDKTTIITRYDNFHLIELPDLQDRYYLLSKPAVLMTKPAETTFNMISPTQKNVHISGATTPFYLNMSESYHPQWQVMFANPKIEGLFNSWVPWAMPDRVADTTHYKLDNFLNGWYIDTNLYCRQKKLCTLNPDGSFDMNLTIEFWPQRWFYVGLIISGTAVLGCVGFLVWLGVRNFRKRKKHN